MSDMQVWRLAQASLKYFSVKFLGIKWLPHYSEWEQIALNEKRAVIQAPRGHGKSTFWSFALPLWDVIRGEADVLLVSYSEDQVRRLIREIKIAVETNPYLEPIRPSAAEIWGTDQLTWSDGGIISGLGFGTSSRGRHPKRIIVDDPLKDMGGMSAEDQERAYFGVITGMAMAETKIATVGTPIDFNDLLAKLESNPVYTKWRRPALEDGKPLCPELFTVETLNMRRLEMGSINFSREYLLERIDPATQPFKRQYETLYNEAPSNFQRIVTVCDPAYTEGDGDFTAIVTVGFTGGNHAYVLEAKAIRKEDPGAIVKELFNTIDAYSPEVVAIEKKKGQALQYTFSEARTRLNRWDFKYVELSHGGRAKDDFTRIGGLVPRWESRTIHIHPEMSELRNQLYAFRFSDKSKEHDDLVDALAYCFHPELVQPNAGKRFVPINKQSTTGKPFYAVGHMRGPDRPMNASERVMLRLDRRVGDAA